MERSYIANTLKHIMKLCLVMFLISAVSMGSLTGCTGKPEHDSSGNEKTMKLSSDNLHDGVWDDVISNTSAGQNHSPALCWDPVDGASEYAIYMIDTSANNWLHWKTGNITSTALNEGQIPETEYIGPYPPSGTHTYEIYVLALKGPAKELAGDFDAANPDPAVLISSADTDKDDNNGNIIATGKLSGTFTHKD